MPLRIFVTVGTHEQPFDRLLVAARCGVERLGSSEWIVQYGTGAFECDSVVRAEPYFAHDDILAYNEWADVVLSHASPGAVFDALGAGAQPIVLPRRRGHGEHVNDHQVRFAAHLEDLELARIAQDKDEVVVLLRAAALEEAAERQSRVAAIHAASCDRSAAFVSAFGQAIEGLRPSRAAVSRTQAS